MQQEMEFKLKQAEQDRQLGLDARSLSHRQELADVDLQARQAIAQRDVDQRQQQVQGDAISVFLGAHGISASRILDGN